MISPGAPPAAPAPIEGPEKPPRKRPGRKKGGKDSKPRKRRSFGPYKLDKASAKAFISNIKIGCPIQMAAGVAGITCETIYQWIRRGKQSDAPTELKKFRADYLKARHFSGQQDMKTLFKAVVEGNISAAQWRLAKRYPKEFGNESTRVELTGAGGGPIKTETRHDGLSAEEMASRMVRAARIAKEVLDKQKVELAIANAIEVGANVAPKLEPTREPVDIVPSAMPPAFLRTSQSVDAQSIKAPDKKPPAAPVRVGMIPMRS